MRFEGTIKTWNDDRGFGFIEAAQGGPDVFVHIKAFGAIDKSAAVAGRRRISESTLLMMGLIGGWSGAIVAQQVLRHKSSKASFRSAFWGTVVVNMAAFVFINAARH